MISLLQEKPVDYEGLAVEQQGTTKQQPMDVLGVRETLWVRRYTITVYSLLLFIRHPCLERERKRIPSEWLMCFSL